MEKSIRPLLDKIFRELNENISPYPSLYGGETGVALYSYAYSSFINQPDTADLFEAQIQRIAEALVNPGLDPSFCNGRSGINWFFTYLNKKNIIDRDDLELFCHNNNELPDIAIA